MGEALAIEVRRERGVPVVTVTGQVDIATVGRLREQVFALTRRGGALVVELDDVGFIDSSGLGALIGVAKRAAAQGGALYVVCARPQTRQLFRLTGLDQWVPLARTLDEALRAAREGVPCPGAPDVDEIIA